ncbi:hypothetical protein BCR42DRAFT_488151 [Absidia repens]|uniref:Uncharacterized protein n=1 Tax=Absidia repens TaxID=90262 RepID=A0A1X2IV01_9FUNG|nr:hypothetical protein BCR42DRAFT_488151 [Absidia repens]
MDGMDVFRLFAHCLSPLLFCFKIMTTTHSSLFDAEELDNTLLSIPEVYTAYVHPTLIMTLRLMVAVVVYCFLTTVHIIFIALKTILWPIYVICHFFIVRPFAFLSQLCHVLYPIAVYFSFAIVCGLIIGGCAGFTAEALSSFFINATWGTQSKRSQSENNSMNTFHGSDDENGNDSIDDHMDDYGYDSDYNAYAYDDHDHGYKEEGEDHHHHQQQQVYGKTMAPNRFSALSQKHHLSAISSSLVSMLKGTPKLEKRDSDDGGSDCDQDELRNDYQRPFVPPIASGNKRMMGKGKLAMRQHPFMTTNGNDDHTPRYRSRKKTTVHVTE